MSESAFCPECFEVACDEACPRHNERKQAGAWRECAHPTRIQRHLRGVSLTVCTDCDLILKDP